MPKFLEIHVRHWFPVIHSVIMIEANDVTWQRIFSKMKTFCKQNNASSDT